MQARLLLVFMQSGDYFSIDIYYFPLKDDFFSQHWLAIDPPMFYKKYSRSLSLLLIFHKSTF